jgi:hypothetical protein
MQLIKRKDIAGGMVLLQLLPLILRILSAVLQLSSVIHSIVCHMVAALLFWQVRPILACQLHQFRKVHYSQSGVL